MLSVLREFQHPKSRLHCAGCSQTASSFCILEHGTRRETLRCRTKKQNVPLTRLCRVQPDSWRRKGTSRGRCTWSSSRQRRAHRRTTASVARGAARWPCFRTGCSRSTLSGPPLGCTTGRASPRGGSQSTRGLSWLVRSHPRLQFPCPCSPSVPVGTHGTPIPS